MASVARPITTLQYSGLKIGIVLAITLLGILFALPNMLSEKTRSILPEWLAPMQLGLDLQGGSYLLLEVDLVSVANEQLVNLEETVRGALREKRLGYRNLRSTDAEVFVTIPDQTETSAARSAIRDEVPEMEIESLSNGRFRITIPDKVRSAQASAAVTQSLEIIRRRIDEFGTSEPSIQRQGSDRIIVELPGVGDPERVKDLIGQTAKLNFHLLEPGAVGTNPRDLPPGTMLVPDSETPEITHVVRRRVEVSGERLTDAQPSFGQDGRPIVSFRFDTVGGRKFGQTTQNNVGQRLAIVLDNSVISAPVINSPIIGGSGMIEGQFTLEGVQDLALLLRAGALPAPLNFLEERTIGPSLGADSIIAGEFASILGVILVGLFMPIAYFSFGIFAVIALTANIGLLIGVLSFVGATLTLPGIAGIVLTLGMAVDANVLIYERMRDEFKSGRTLMNSLGSGFQAAFTTILDANITGLIAGVLLFFLGSGPVQGFAVTLTIGIATSMFSALMITRMLVWLWFTYAKPQNLPI
ncbi:MAG: protein translocase subunit SecD [Candidatus Marinimicrobia bacterium]|nr:protein translocase subunit SecD [Candidatus Neomarinimicrobiota bacterium]